MVQITIRKQVRPENSREYIYVAGYINGSVENDTVGTEIIGKH